MTVVQIRTGHSPTFEGDPKRRGGCTFLGLGVCVFRGFPGRVGEGIGVDLGALKLWFGRAMGKKTNRPRLGLTPTKRWPSSPGLQSEAHGVREQKTVWVALCFGEGITTTTIQ